MFGLGMSELVLILVISLVVFGPGKLPEIGKAVGKSLGEFRKASTEEPPAAVPVHEKQDYGAENAPKQLS